MHRQLLLLAGVLALAILGLTTTAGRSADDKDKIVIPKDIAEAVNKMADTVAKGGDPKADAEALAKKYNEPGQLKKIMWVFKPRMEGGDGGFGVGSKPGAYSPDGIETYIAFKSNPMRGKVTAKELKDGAADFNRLADITIAMAAVSHQYTPKKKEADKDPRDWTKFTDEMKKGAEDLKSAVKGDDSVKAKAAFGRMYSACNNCHTTFRD
jgi:cytochrome c556